MKTPFVSLNNRYFVIRHGQSYANARRVLASRLETDAAYGLTDLGKRQVLQSFQVAELGLDSKTIVYSSPFRRAQETAAIAADFLQTAPPIVDPVLGERTGDWLEGRSSNWGVLVVVADALSDSHNLFGVESIEQMQTRLISFIGQLEAKHSGATFLICSHGHPLQMIQAALLGVSCRRVRLFANAEIRELKVA